MRERLRIFLYFAIFWLGFQIFIRAIFLIYNFEFTAELTAKEVLLAFLHGLKMDASISGYFLMLNGLLISITVFTEKRWPKTTIHTLNIIVLLLSTTVACVDLELYKHWGFRMNTTPLMYVGSEAFGSVNGTVALILVLIFALTVTVFLWIYRSMIARRIDRLVLAERKAVIPLLILTAAMFLPIRGSIGVAPMNSGFVFFHRTKSFANHAAINVTWNFLYSVQKANLNYPEDFFDKSLTQQYFKSLYPETDSTVQIFNTPRPNILLFMLESFTSDVMEPLGGWKGVTPELNKLWSESFAFDNIYASGVRTDKGIISILSGYPSQPLTSIIMYPAKTQSLPYLNHHMERLGYQTSFVYGGDIDFANFRSYLTNCRFHHLTTEDDFDDELNYSKWGVHDHLVLQQTLHECDTASTPFFKVVLTLSTHEPFDVPHSSKFISETDEGLFLNAWHYTDSALGNFVREAKERDWWKNTVCIFIADHGHRLPGYKESKDRRRFRIPLFMIGGAVKKDSLIHTFGNQTDIANTLLAQLDKPVKDFTFSKDLISPEAKSFSVYFFTDGYGFVAPGKFIQYDNPGKIFLESEGATELDLDISKAYQQTLYSDYNSR